MKKLLIGILSLVPVIITHAQNIGIGITTPASSALLDVSSSNKGMLIPRMTSEQRTNIASPVTGLLVFDTTTKTIWAYDGSSWKNLYTSGGLVLPFSQSINTAVPGFQVVNQGIAAAIEGSSSHEFGAGISAKATGLYGWAINAYSNRPASRAIHAITDSGAIFHGENLYPGNNNTLMYLLNRGIGRSLHVQLANSNSTSPNLYVAGNQLGSQIEVYNTNALNSHAAINISNSGTGAGVFVQSPNGIGVSGNSTNGNGVFASSFNGNGVYGVTNSSTGNSGVMGGNTGTDGTGVMGVSNAVNTQGVHGSSISGIGVKAWSNTYRGLQAEANNGVAIYGSSTNGYALETSGKVKIAGGNTSPADGAVLTSDAVGNAVWKKREIAFKVGNIHYDYNEVPRGSEWKVMFTTEQYDYAGNFDAYTSGTPSATSSTFTTPVAGLYHFDVRLELTASLYEDIEDSYIIIRKQQGNVITDIAKARGTLIFDPGGGGVAVDVAMLQISTDAKLQVGDKVWVIVYQYCDGTDPAIMVPSSGTLLHQFSGHLVFAD